MDWSASNPNTGLIQVPVILLFTIGLMALNAWRRHPGWWMMAGGVVILLLGFISQTFVLQTAAESSLFSTLAFFIRLRGWGFVIFGFGFATLGGPLANAQRRLLELDPSSAPGKTARPANKGGRKS